MNFIVIVVSSLPGNKDFVVVYEKLVLCETNECCSHYCIADFETAAGKVLYQSVFSSPLSDLYKLESLSWLLKLSSN